MPQPNILANLFPYLKRVPVLRRLFEVDPIAPRDPEALPRVIYMFWDTGLETAPELVRFCVESWQRLNPGWTVTVLDGEAARAIVDRADLPASMSIQAYSDLLRITLLAERGGVWADATALCLRPLDDWLAPVFVQADFFAFYRPGRDRIMSNWFMAATQGAPLATSMRDFYLYFWKRPVIGRKPYFCFHYLFEYLVRISPSLRRQWQAVPRISAEPQHLLQDWHTQGARDPAPLAQIRQSHVQKLSYKIGLTVEDLRALLATLDTKSTAKLLD